MLKMNASKYLFCVIWSLGLLLIQCEKSSAAEATPNSVKNEQSYEEGTLMNQALDETADSNNRRQRVELLKNLLEAMREEDESPFLVDNEFDDDEADDSVQDTYLAKRNDGRGSSYWQKKDAQQLRRQVNQLYPHL